MVIYKNISTVLVRFTIITFLLSLYGCSSGSGTSGSGGGSSSSGLGADISGQWRADLYEARSPTHSGNLTFLIQAGNVSLNPSISLKNSVTGTFSYQNFLTSQCPVNSIVGIIKGEITGNNVIFFGEEEPTFNINWGGNIIDNNRISGDWNMHFKYSISVDDKDVAQACNLFGTFTAFKTGS